MSTEVATHARRTRLSTYPPGKIEFFHYPIQKLASLLEVRLYGVQVVRVLSAKTHEIFTVFYIRK